MKKVLFIFFMFLITNNVYSESISNDIMNENINNIDFDYFDNIIHQNENRLLDNFDVKHSVIKVLKGEEALSFDRLVKDIFSIIFNEVKINIDLLGKLIVIAVLSSILSNLTNSFERSSIGKIGYFSCYIVLISILFSSFTVLIGIANETIDKMVYIMKGILPPLITCFIYSGNTLSATIFHPLILFICEMSGVFIKNIILPLILFTCVLQIINYLSNKKILNNMVVLMKQISNVLLKGMLLIFVGIMTVQGLTIPISDGVASKGAKVALQSLVPVVGTTLSGAIDTVFNCSLLLRNAIGVIGVISLFLYCIIPIIKICIIVLIYKISAAIVEPITENKISNIIAEVGESSMLILSCVISISIMFIICMTILIGVSNITAMMR